MATNDEPIFLDPATGELSRIYVPELKHKPGCLWVNKPLSVHRVPIDCVTEDDLWKQIEVLKAENAGAAVVIRDLKARIYDLEHEEER